MPLEIIVFQLGPLDNNSYLALPPTTRLLSGHGPETTIQEELAENPFL